MGRQTNALTHNLSSYYFLREWSDPLTDIQWENCLELESMEVCQIDMDIRKKKQREGRALTIQYTVSPL